MSTAIDRYNELEMEITMLRATARRLHDEGDVGLAAETDAEALQLEEKMEELIVNVMSPAEQNLCCS